MICTICVIHNRTIARFPLHVVRHACVLGLLLLLLAASPDAMAQGSERSWLPELEGRVTDGADILPDEFERLFRAKLQAYEEETSHQIVVLTVADLRGESIESFSLRAANTWGLGREEFDNGILFTIAPNERRVRVEIGLGLQRVIPDRLAQKIIKESILPPLRDGDWERAVREGTERLMEAASALKVGLRTRPDNIAELLEARNSFDNVLIDIEGTVASIAEGPTPTGPGGMRWILHIDDGTGELRVAGAFEDVLSLRAGMRLRKGDRLRARGVFHAAVPVENAAITPPELDAASGELELLARVEASSDAPFFGEDRGSFFGPEPGVVPTGSVETPWSLLVGFAAIVAVLASSLGLLLHRQQPVRAKPRLAASGPFVENDPGGSPSPVRVRIVVDCPRKDQAVLADPVLLHAGGDVFRAQSTRLIEDERLLTFPLVVRGSVLEIECEFLVPWEATDWNGARVTVEDTRNERLLSAQLRPPTGTPHQSAPAAGSAISLVFLILFAATQPAWSEPASEACQRGPGEKLGKVSFCLVSFERRDAVRVSIPMEPPSPATGPIVEHPDGTRADPDTERFIVMGARRPHVFVRQEIKAPDSRFLVAGFILENHGKSSVSLSPSSISFRADWVGDVEFAAVGFDGFLILKRTDAERALAAGAKTDLQTGEARTLRYLIAVPPEGKLTWSADGENWKPLTNAAARETGNL